MGIQHAHQTAIADDPRFDVSADEWNGDHLITSSVDFSSFDALVADGQGIKSRETSNPALLLFESVASPDSYIKITNAVAKAGGDFSLGPIIEATGSASTPLDVKASDGSYYFGPNTVDSGLGVGIVSSINLYTGSSYSTAPAGAQLNLLNQDSFHGFSFVGWGSEGMDFNANNMAFDAYTRCRFIADPIVFNTDFSDNTIFELIVSSGVSVGSSDLTPGRGSIAVPKVIYVTEMTAPDAPGANVGALFMQDNGSGKTQFCVRFPTGAIQALATEP